MYCWQQYTFFSAKGTLFLCLYGNNDSLILLTATVLQQQYKGNVLLPFNDNNRYKNAPLLRFRILLYLSPCRCYRGIIEFKFIRAFVCELSCIFVTSLRSTCS
jgi:hypothetical protein